MKFFHPRFFCFCILVLLSAELHAQERYVVQKFDGDIILDGLNNEPGWQAVDPLPLIMFRPEYGGVPTEKTELKLAYDENYLYFSGVLV